MTSDCRASDFASVGDYKRVISASIVLHDVLHDDAKNRVTAEHCESIIQQ